MSVFENELQRAVYSKDNEKTFLDKILSRRDVERIRELMRKEFLDRGELLELMYMCLSTESKLLNLNEWDRYVLLKFFTWIRGFISIAELIYDHIDYIDNYEKTGRKFSPRTHMIIKNNIRLVQHNAKFLIDLYFNIARTTLSLGGTGFLEPLKQKFEMNYGGLNPVQPDVNRPRGYS